MKKLLTIIVLMLLTRKRAIIETVNDELKKIDQVEHSRHRSFDNFMVNLLGALAAYCFFPNIPLGFVISTNSKGWEFRLTFLFLLILSVPRQ